MTAAVLTIGTELLRGELVDSNAAWLGEELTSLGLDVRRHLTVGDDVDDIAGALHSLLGQVRVVVATGGLGPTTDDRTSEAVARALGADLVRDDPSWEAIKRRYEARGRDLLPCHAKQAEFPRGARVLENPEGTAPGFAIERDGVQAFFLPGVPREMKAIFARSVVPRIAELGHRDRCRLHVRVFGLPESEVAERLRPLEESNPDVAFGFRATFPEIEVKVEARAETASEAEERAKAVADRVRELLGDAAYGDRDDTFAGVVGQDLRSRGFTLAVAESCTGGLIGTMLTSVPGSSDYLLLDAVTYANSAKTQVLGVSPEILRAHGAVSAETACAMAEGARRAAGADLAISTTGIAGPGGGSDSKPVGTVWLGLASAEGTLAVRHQFHGDRAQVRTQAAYVALEMVRRHLRGRDPAEGASARTISDIVRHMDLRSRRQRP